MWVDTEGNQLPYIDKIQMTIGENLEVLNLRAIAGEYDIQERHTDLSKLPVYLENQQRSNFKVYFDPRSSGADTTLQRVPQHPHDGGVGVVGRGRSAQ